MKPTIILLPGLDGTSRLFNRLTDAFGPEIEARAIAYPLDVPLDYKELEDLVRSQLPTDRQYFLLGESFSGPIALSISASPPQGLLGTVLCCSFAKTPLPWLRYMRALTPLLPTRAMPISLLRFLLLGHHTNASLESTLKSVLDSVSPRVLRKRLKEVLGIDVSPCLANIRLPLLLLNAANDRIVPRSASKFIAAKIPEACMREFAAPHFLLQTFPEDAASSICEFMRTTMQLPEAVHRPTT